MKIFMDLKNPTLTPEQATKLAKAFAFMLCAGCGVAQGPKDYIKLAYKGPREAPEVDPDYTVFDMPLPELLNTWANLWEFQHTTCPEEVNAFMKDVLSI